MSEKQYEDDIYDGNIIFEEKTSIKLKKPQLYRVLLHNDDYTPMDFVTYILMQVFGKSRQESEQIMLTVHTKGIGLCGIYTFDIARTKQYQVTQAARKNEHPLKCTIEPEVDEE